MEICIANHRVWTILTSRGHVKLFSLGQALSFLLLSMKSDRSLLPKTSSPRDMDEYGERKKESRYRTRQSQSDFVFIARRYASIFFTLYKIQFLASLIIFLLVGVFFGLLAGSLSFATALVLIAATSPKILQNINSCTVRFCSLNSAKVIMFPLIMVSFDKLLPCLFHVVLRSQ